MDDLRRQFEVVMDSMVRAGWLKSHIFTTGKGHHLVWTTEGGQRAVLMKEIVVSHGLDQDDRSPIAFDMLSKGERLPAARLAFEPEEILLAFWKSCVDELEVHGDELLVLIQIVKGWAPDRDAG